MKVKRTCNQCGTNIEVTLYRIKMGRGKFCTTKCHDRWRSENRSGKNSHSWKGNKVKRICKQCNKEFDIYPHEIKRGRGVFHTKKCYSLWLSKNQTSKNNPNWKDKIKVKCKQCSKNFDVSLSRIKVGGGKFHSKKCQGLWVSVSETFTGKNNPNWKGGIRKIRDRNILKYKLWRKSVFERDRFRCLICGKVGGDLNAHHIKNWAGYPKLRYDINNGMTMCEKCHNLVDKELPLFSIKQIPAREIRK